MWVRKLLNKTLEETNSPINGKITVYTSFGVPKMSIGGLLQSGGIVADIWKKLANKIISYKLKVNSILILGLGCGTAAQVFSQKFLQAGIIGIEIDPMVINLGKKYFSLNKIQNLKIICADARKYIKNKNKFDLIIIDMYLGEKIPPGSQAPEFLKNIKRALNPGGLVVFNRLFWDKHKKEAQDFVQKTEKIFDKITLQRTVANLLVICSQTN